MRKLIHHVIIAKCRVTGSYTGHFPMFPETSTFVLVAEKTIRRAMVSSEKYLREGLAEYIKDSKPWPLPVTPETIESRTEELEYDHDGYTVILVHPVELHVPYAMLEEPRKSAYKEMKEHKLHCDKGRFGCWILLLAALIGIVVAMISSHNVDKKRAEPKRERKPVSICPDNKKFMDRQIRKGTPLGRELQRMKEAERTKR